PAVLVEAVERRLAGAREVEDAHVRRRRAAALVEGLLQAALEANADLAPARVEHRAAEQQHVDVARLARRGLLHRGELGVEDVPRRAPEGPRPGGPREHEARGQLEDDERDERDEGELAQAAQTTGGTRRGRHARRAKCSRDARARSLLGWRALPFGTPEERAMSTAHCL